MITLILKYELKKIFSKKPNQVVLAVAVLLAVVFSIFAIRSIRYVDKQGVLHEGTLTAARCLASDKNQWKGTLTGEKIASVVKSRKEMDAKYPEDIPDTAFGETIQSYNDISDFVINIMTPDSPWDKSVLYQLTDEQMGELYNIYKNNMLKMSDEYGKTPEQQKFLMKQYEKIQMPITYEAPVSWDTMILYAETYEMVLAIVIGFLTAGIFAEEFRNRAESVYYSTKYGRSKATKNKILAGILTTTIVYWTGAGILTLISFTVMGTSGIHTPYQLMFPYSIYSMTFGQYYLLILICGYIASLLTASTAMLTTAKMHTPYVAVCIPFFMLCVLPFIARALPSFAAFFNLMPCVLTNILNCARTPILYQIGNTVFRQIPLVITLYTALSILLLPFAYRCYCRYGLKKE